MNLRTCLIAVSYIWLGGGHLHAQQISQQIPQQIQCNKLGVDLSTFIKLKAVDQPDASKSADVSKPDPSTPAAGARKVPMLNDLRQEASDGHLKHLEPVLTEEEVLACFANNGRELIFLRNSVENQRQRFRDEKKQNRTMFLYVELATILLGALRR